MDLLHPKPGHLRVGSQLKLEDSWLGAGPGWSGLARLDALRKMTAFGALHVSGRDEGGKNIFRAQLRGRARRPLTADQIRPAVVWSILASFSGLCSVVALG